MEKQLQSFVFSTYNYNKLPDTVWHHIFQMDLKVFQYFAKSNKVLHVNMNALELFV